MTTPFPLARDQDKGLRGIKKAVPAVLAWAIELQGRVDAADAPSWDRALAQYVSEWRGSDDSLTIGQHLVVDDCKIRDLDRDDDEPYWIPFYT